jgi:ABC-type multidrug transport system fused ATPase/permease subunit
MSLRRAIGVVSQDSMLFNESVRYNIGYGREGATNKEIEACAKRAQLHSKILTLPDGYDAIVGDRGVRLSAGEKQRISIARAMLKRCVPDSE